VFFSSKVQMHPFDIVSERPSPRFLGLSVAERNRRVAQRTAGPESANGARGTLTIPAGVAITPALVRTLPPPNGLCRLVWDPHRAPILWHGPGVADDPGARTVRLPEGAALDVSTPAARRRSAWRLLHGSGKPSDGWLSRTVHRKISRLFSYTFLSMGLSANAASVVTFGVGLVAAWMMAQTTHATMIAGGALFWFAAIADGIDGEMARLTVSESKFGEQLDTGLDQATYLCVLAGVFVGWYRQGMGPGELALGVVVALSLPAMLLWGMTLVRRARGTRQFFVPTKPIEAAVISAARQGRAAPLRAAAAVFVLFRREAFSLTFFLLSLMTGERLVYPAVLAAGLAIAGTALLVCRSEIERQLRAAWPPAREPLGRPDEGGAGTAATC
jgi:phosphatidylglycerophosphate synthase